MKRIIGLMTAFVLILSVAVCAAPLDSTKVIYYLEETAETVELSAVVKGPAQQFMGATFFTWYDHTRIEPQLDTYKIGEKVSGWTAPEIKVSASDVKEGKVLRYWLTAVDNKEIYLDIAAGEEVEIASISFKKLGNVDASVISTQVVHNLRAGAEHQTNMQSIVGTQLFSLTNAVMPEAYSIKFTPYFEGESNVPAESVVITDEENCNAMAVGKEKVLSAEIVPHYADAEIKWSAEGGVTVSEDGKVTAKTVGEAKVTATAGDVSATYEITVVEKEILPESVEIIAEYEEYIDGGIYEFKAKVLPENATNKNVIWSNDGVTNAYINSKTGVMEATGAGKINVTAAAAANPEVKATLPITIYANIPAGSRVSGASIMVNDVLYANSLSWAGDKEYKINFCVFDENGRYVTSALWKNHYVVEYEDNLNGLTGIKRDGNKIIISKDAQDAENLKIKATIKQKADGKLICTAETAPFKVVSGMKVDGVEITGGEVTENEDGTYSLKMTEGAVNVKIKSGRTPYVSYRINKYGIVTENKAEINITAENFDAGENTLVLNIHGDSRGGSTGFMLNSHVKSVVIKITNSAN